MLTELQREYVDKIHIPSLEKAQIDLFLPINVYDDLLKFEYPKYIFPRYRGRNLRILWILRDAGGFSAGLPVMNLLKDEAVDLYIVADNPAKRELESKIDSIGLMKTEECSVGGRMVQFLPDGVVTGHSAKFDLEQVFTAVAKDTGAKSVLYEDMSPFAAFYRRIAAREGWLVVPDHFFAGSESSAKISAQFVPQFANRTSVVGNPAFDKFVSENFDSTYKRVRQELGIEDDEKLIVYMATKTRATFLTFRDLVNYGANKLNGEKYKLSVRVHPQEQKDPQIKEDYATVLAKVGDHAVNTMLPNDEGKMRYSTDEIRLAADIVVTDTSTAGFEAILDKGRRLVIHALIPDNMQVRDEWKDEFPPEPAVIADGSSAVVRGKKEFEGVLKSLFNDAETQTKMLEASQIWKNMNDGQSAQRFRDRLMEIVQKIIL